MEQIYTIETPHGPIDVTITRKRVKNLNLRVETGGRVYLSIPMNCSLKKAKQTVMEKSGWIVAARTRQQYAAPAYLPEPESREACLALMRAAVVRVYPLVAPLGVAMPEVRIRKMRSQWGNCHWAQGYITMNAALARVPDHLREYVALHELIHFLHHDHGPAFRAKLDRLMPCWQEYRKELRVYGGLLE